MLVALAVLLVLISLLSPALNKVINHARKMACLNNIRVIGTAYQAYAEDYNGAIPISANRSPYNYYRWYFETAPYLDIEISTLANFDAEGTVFECTTHDYRENDLPKYFGGYGLNYKFAGFVMGSSRVRWQRKKFSDMEFSRETILLGDSQDFKDLSKPKNLLPLAYIYSPINSAYLGQVGASIRHQRTFNKLWGDLHVSNDLWDEIAQGRNGDIEYFYRFSK